MHYILKICIRSGRSLYFIVTMYTQCTIESKGCLSKESVLFSSAHDGLEPKAVTVGRSCMNATIDPEGKEAEEENLCPGSTKDHEGKQDSGQAEFQCLATAIDQETEDQLQVGATREVQDLLSPPTRETQGVAGKKVSFILHCLYRLHGFVLIQSHLYYDCIALIMHQLTFPLQFKVWFTCTCIHSLWHCTILRN